MSFVVIIPERYASTRLPGKPLVDISDKTMIVNVLGDEPMIPAKIIRKVADNLAQRKVGMATLAVQIHNAEEAFNPKAVKVVLDAEGYALYFSRATIPWDRDRFAKGLETVGDNFLRHLGIYGYRAGFIRRYGDSGGANPQCGRSV